MRISLLSLTGAGPFPLGLGYLHAALCREHEVIVRHDQTLNWSANEHHLAYFRPAVVGLTCTSYNRGVVRRMTPMIHALLPSAKVVVGGCHATFCDESVLRDYGADVVVRGEGERTTAELCAALRDGGSLGDVAGISYLTAGGEVVRTPDRPVVANLDDLPLPDYGYGERHMAETGMGFLIGSRGCPARCAFCCTSAYWGQRVRVHSPERIAAEMRGLVERFGVRKVFFHDDTFNLSESRVLAVCKAIVDAGVRVEWGCSCRVHPVSDAMIDAMIAAGCTHICWGVESGSERMLERIGKRITREQIRRAFALSSARAERLSTGAFVMVGNPGETAQTVAATCAFLDELPMTDAPSVDVCRVLPGTDVERLSGLPRSHWASTDEVPAYTSEHSYARLATWRMRTLLCGKRIPYTGNSPFWGDRSRTMSVRGQISDFVRRIAA